MKNPKSRVGVLKEEGAAIFPVDDLNKNRKGIKKGITSIIKNFSKGGEALM